MKSQYYSSLDASIFKQNDIDIQESVQKIVSQSDYISLQQIIA